MKYCKNLLGFLRKWEGVNVKCAKQWQSNLAKRIEVFFKTIKSSTKNMKISAKQAVEIMKVSAEDKAILLKRF